jgi:hypothetical protein
MNANDLMFDDFPRWFSNLKESMKAKEMFDAMSALAFNSQRQKYIWDVPVSGEGLWLHTFSSPENTPLAGLVRYVNLFNVDIEKSTGPSSNNIPEVLRQRQQWIWLTPSDNKISDSTRWLQHVLLSTVYSELYKTRLLSPALPRTMLRMFGGPLDIEQYRDYTTGANDIVLSDLPPIRLQFPSMNVQGPLRDIKKYVSLSVDVVEKASEQLRLKRSKPVNSNIQTLDMCMNKS